MSTTRLRILAVVTAFLIGPASSTPGTLTVAQTSRLDVRSRTELVLECGDQTSTGVVKYWQTPFGQLRNHGHSGNADFAVSMRADGSLLAANADEIHSGLYYCLLVAERGTTIWPYQVHVGVDLQMARGNPAEEPGFTRDPVPLRHRRDLAGSGPTERQGQAGPIDGVFAGAVAGSVLLTFVLGFTAGALGRAHVLRCLSIISSKIRSLWRRRSNGRGCEVVMTTLPDTYHSEVIDDDMAWPSGDPTLDTTCSSCTSSPPPPKPQRSFRREAQEKERKEGETEEKYVEERMEVGMEERRDRREEKQIREEVEKRRERRDEDKENEMERKGGRHGVDAEGEPAAQEMEESGVTGDESRVGGDQSMTVTMTECSSQDGGVPGRRSAGVDEEEVGLVKEQIEATSTKEEFQNSGGKTDNSSDSDSDSSSDTQDGREQEKPEEEVREQAEKEGAEEEASATAGVRRGRRRRVIRLYQYDEEGQRYSHLPSPAPGEMDPAPRLKQRTLSLTRLSTIMAAATVGPLACPSGGAEGEERCPSPPFSPAAVFKMDV